MQEILPECFKTLDHTQELLDHVDEAVRLMPDEAHLCSAKFLQSALDTFKAPSETEAVKMIKKGQTPDKILK